MWIERKIEGDRMKRLKLDAQPWTARKLGLKAAKHGTWIALALWTGITFVGYFTPIRTLLGELAGFSLGPWETFWVFFYGFATYGNAGWMREQVCKYMCPYARFQGVMFDPDALIIPYDPARGEPRGSRSKSLDHRAKGLGDCVDCGICVQVCPTGIDIRNGLQYECIACGACIDGCDQVMDKVGYPRGLIRYSTENAMSGKYPEEETALGKIKGHLMRPRVIVYMAILSTVVVAMAVTLAMRVPVKLNVLKDRANLVRETNDGWLENVYRLQIMNTAETPHRFVLAVTGLPGAKLVSDAPAVDVAGASSVVVPVRVQLEPNAAAPGSHRIDFEVKAQDDPSLAARARSSFYLSVP
jgi:cytochrome c oxidase accessory protein FixG